MNTLRMNILGYVVLPLCLVSVVVGAGFLCFGGDGALIALGAVALLLCV